MLVRDRVTSVRELPHSEEYVYDLEVDGAHTFVANNVLVHNTDSMYIKIPADNGMDFVTRFNAWFRQHLIDKFGIPSSRIIVELEYENYFKRIFFVRKKRYAGLMTMYKGADASFTEIKGFECMRSDGIEYARLMQKTVIEMIVRERRGPKAILDFLITQRDKVIGSKLGVDEITITKAITKPMDQYKSRTVHLQIAEDYRKKGGEFYVGMKIPYIVTNGSKGKIQAIHVDDFTGAYDHQYYWSKLIYPPTFRILMACYPGVSWEQLFVGLTDAQIEKLRQKESENRDNGDDDDAGSTAESEHSHRNAP